MRKLDPVMAKNQNRKKQTRTSPNQNGFRGVTREPPERRELVAVYLRVSTEEQAKHDNLDRQRFLCDKIVKKLLAEGAMVVGTFSDEGYNLESFEATRAFWKILSLVEKSMISTIVIAADDRIFRGEKASIRGKILDTLRRGGVRVVTPVSDVVYSLADSQSRLVSSLSQEIGSANKIELVKSLQTGFRLQVETRKYHQPVAPYGIRVDRTLIKSKKHFSYRVVATEAAIIRDVFALYCGRKPKILPPGGDTPIGYVRIARILREAGVSREAWISEAAKNASPLWTAEAVVKILNCELYTGVRTIRFRQTHLLPEKQVRQVCLETPIVDLETFEAAQKIRKERGESSDHSDAPMVTPADVWFHDFLHCGHCGMHLSLINHYKRGSSYYGCRKRHVMPRLDFLKTAVGDLVKSLTFNEAFKGALKDRALDKINTDFKKTPKQSGKTKLTELHTLIDRLTERYALDEVSQAEYERSMDSLKVEVTIAERDARLHSKRGLANSALEILRPKEAIEQAVTELTEDLERGGRSIRVVFAAAKLLVIVNKQPSHDSKETNGTNKKPVYRVHLTKTEPLAVLGEAYHGQP